MVAAPTLRVALINRLTRRFNFGSMEEGMDTTQTSQVVNKLHTILAPFLLRRMKTDVEANLVRLLAHKLFLALWR